MSMEKILSENAYIIDQPKGVAMLIHNNLRSHSAKSFVERPGTDRKKDVGNLVGALCTQFGFYVIQRSNMTSLAMRQHMIGLSDQYHGYQGNHNSLLVVVISQANSKGQVIDLNGDPISANELLEHFVHSRCPALIGKPKIFLLLLKVTVKESSLPAIEEARARLSKRSQIVAVEAESPRYFEPEPMSVEENCLVVRVMYEDEGAFSESPTFGGIGSGPEEDIPWFAATFISVLAEQAGSKDLLSIMKNLKKEYQNHVTTARSAVTTTSSSVSGNNSLSVQRRSKGAGHVNVFIDESLKKKLYIAPGL